MDEIRLATAFAVSLAVGLLIGLERERNPGRKAGLRTFALTALTGTLSALLSQQSGASWLLPAGAVGLTGMMVVANRNGEDQPAAQGTTTTVALLLCYLLGATLWHGYAHVVGVIALSATALLYFKAELHGVSRSLSRQDLVSFLQFAAVTVIVLPLLPNKGYGPYQALNPFTIWLMVVLVSGLGLAGYAAMRLMPDGAATPVLGLLGGLVSSTATTLVFARQARGDVRRAPAALAVILVANLVALVRVAVLAVLAAPGVWRSLLPVLGLGLALGAVVAGRHVLALSRTRSRPHEVRNPVALREALLFGALFAAVLLAMAWVHDHAGDAGLYLVAFVSGLTDMDAVTLSVAQLAQGGQIDAARTTAALVLAYGANLLLKAGLVLGIAGRALAQRVALGYLGVLGGLVVGLLLPFQ